MKSLNVVFTRVGKAEVQEHEVGDPREGEIQVRCVANGICMAEVTQFTGDEPRDFPREVGHEGIGQIVKVGPGVRGLSEGDWVDCWKWNTIQNFAASRAHKYGNTPGDPGIMLAEPVACVIRSLYASDIYPGDRALLIGAGFMGLLNAQGMGHYPLGEFVAVDVKPENLRLARAYGATEIVQVGTPDGDARYEELKQDPFDIVIEAAGAEKTIQDAGSLTRRGGRLIMFAWHHHPRSVDMGLWHTRGLKVLNTAPGIGSDVNVDAQGRAVRLLDNGVFNLSEMVTHRHHVTDVQEAMEISTERGAGFIKGVLTFE